MVFIDLQAVLCLQVDFAAKFSIEAKQRIMPGLRVLATAFAGIPGIIPLQGGLPPSEAFPLTGISLRLRDGSTIDINEQSEVCLPSKRQFHFSDIVSCKASREGRWQEEGFVNCLSFFLPKLKSVLSYIAIDKVDWEFLQRRPWPNSDHPVHTMHVWAIG